MKKWARSIYLILLLVMIAGALVGCRAQRHGDGNTDADGAGVIRTLDDLDGKRVAVLAGSTWDTVAQRDFPGSERKYFNSTTDMILALEQQKIDAFFADMTVYASIRWENPFVAILDETVSSFSNALIMSKQHVDRELLAQLNAFITQSKQDGTIDALLDKWFSDAEPTEHPDYRSLSGGNGTLRIAVENAMKPMTYRKDQFFTGFDVDLMTKFAQAYGYRLEIEGMAFDALIPSVTSGKFDIGMCGITITEEREESMVFSDPYIETYGVVVINEEANGGAAAKPPIGKLSEIKNARLAVLTGTIWDAVARENFPDAEVKYFSSMTDMILALEQGKVDAILGDKTFYVTASWEDVPVSLLNESIGTIACGMMLHKDAYDATLLAQLNAFIAQLRADGTMDALAEKWLSDSEPDEHPDYRSLSGENGTLRIAVDNTAKPMTYRKNDMFTGCDVELLTMFAAAHGYALEIMGMSFDALIPAVASGKCDIGICGIAITEERAENVTFTDCYLELDGVVFVNTEAGGAAATQRIQKVEDIDTLAVMTGTVWDGVARTSIPDADIKYFSTTTDLLLALKQGKVDALLGPKTFYATACWEDVPAALLDETFGAISSGFMLAGEGYDEQLLAQLNAYIAQAKQDGTADALAEKWIGTAEPTEHPDYLSLDGENGTLTVAVDQTAKPMVYRKGDTFTGYDVEFLTNFARSYGYRLEFVGMSFDALLPYVSGGKCDLGACGVAITEERAESVTFTDSYLTIDGVVIVNPNATAPVAKDGGLLQEIAEGFEKTFIREDRWKLILEGIGVTLLISISAAAGGTLLGFGLYLLCRTDVKPVRTLARGVARVYARIVAGTPIVVILMILFYVVFGKFRDMNGIVVAILGFSLTFGAFVYGHMNVSVGSVDHGQTEAAYALGYTKRKTFFRIILPQAMTIFMPTYCGQSVELVKATAVVGYIAVNDLTKMGDIIRSNTYEAFFPLIATALIYFLLTWLLALLLNAVKRRFEPQNRGTEEILRGIEPKA